MRRALWLYITYIQISFFICPLDVLKPTLNACWIWSSSSYYALIGDNVSFFISPCWGAVSLLLTSSSNSDWDNITGNLEKQMEDRKAKHNIRRISGRHLGFHIALFNSKMISFPRFLLQIEIPALDGLFDLLPREFNAVVVVSQP